MVCVLLNFAFDTEISRLYSPLRKCIVHPVRLLSGVKKMCYLYEKGLYCAFGSSRLITRVRHRLYCVDNPRISSVYEATMDVWRVQQGTLGPGST